jgi:NADPH:quinone reductase-like Zn-dependent oxidoreductase
MQRHRISIATLTALGALLGLAAVATTVFAQAPSTMRQYQFEPAGSGYRLAMKEVAMPVAGKGEVLVRIHATSLNRRDIYMLNDSYGDSGSAAGGVPLSDGAGEVVAVGEGVTRFQVGDRVAGTFFPLWVDGNPSAASLAYARGGSDAGMLSEYVASPEDGLVHIPDHLSFEEAATLPCAALTAWVGLFKRGGLADDDFVLLEGTGGVSVFGLLLSSAAGAKPIITSSSDEKLSRAREFGAVGTANYRSNPDWQREVMSMTGDHGVDQVLEVGGRDTLPKALEALAYGGHIALIGGLSGFAPDIPPGALMWKNATASGIYVGSRADFVAMNAFISEHDVRPVIDRVFEFDAAAEAFDYMDTGSFMGKIVIRVN